MTAPPSRPEVTATLTRGVVRVFAHMGFAPLCEVSLANSRRADVMGLSRKGRIWIAEVKSGVPDYVADSKWREYAPFCDAFFFAVDESFPQALIPEDTGLIVADGFGGEIIRQSPDLALPGARRKAVTLAFARVAAMRLALGRDPVDAEVGEG